MVEKEIMNIIEKFNEKLPKFPDGRIDYSKSKTAPVITVFIKYNNEILILKRSNKVSNYRGKWNTVVGYIDEPKSLRNKVLEEVQEELGIAENKISLMRFGKFYKLKDNEIGKIWLIQPVLVELKKRPKIKLDWEHIEYKWINQNELKKFDIVPGLDKSLKMLVC